MIPINTGLKIFSSLKTLLILLTVWLICFLSGTINSTVAPETDSTLWVAELPFYEKLTNPCALVRSGGMEGNILPSGNERLAIRKIILDDLKEKILQLGKRTERVLGENVLPNCKELELPTVGTIPSYQDKSSEETMELLLTFYSSVLNHTVHMYYIGEQMEKYSSDDTCNNPELAESSRILASHMREIMCLLKLTHIVFKESLDKYEGDNDLDSALRILDDYLVDQPICSRRWVRNCQIVSSTYTLTKGLQSFLEKMSL